MIKAREHCCQESNQWYPQFPCNQLATRIIKFVKTNEGPYRMCDGCAEHSVKNRGATDIGPYVKEEK